MAGFGEGVGDLSKRHPSVRLQQLENRPLADRLIGARHAVFTQRMMGKGGMVSKRI
ncbi:MAG: hypothetical protein LLH30_12745 [Candidatus Manganitrophus sp. SA1]|nr:hypothetical protein [Candidatus Manganitrophus morganii]